MSTNIVRRRGAHAVTSLLLALLVGVLAGCSAAGSDSAPATGSKDGSSTIAEKAPQVATYVALGDSYTAAPLVPVTDVANGCFRSSGNYPALAAKALGSKLDDRSCGGADTTSFAQAQGPGIPAQKTALRADTDLVTVGFGGNDGAVFGTLINRCPALRSQDPGGAPCRTAMSSTGKDEMLAKLSADATTPHRGRRPGAPALPEGHGAARRLSPDRRRRPRLQPAAPRQGRLRLRRAREPCADRGRAGAAKASGSTYVDVWSASQGHDVCSADPWINGTVNDQKRAARFHPFAVEQAAVAALVEKAASGRFTLTLTPGGA